MPQPICPSQDELLAFNQGLLPEAASTAIAAHLQAGCPECDRVLTQIKDQDDPTTRLFPRRPLSPETTLAAGPPEPTGQVGNQSRRHIGNYAILEELGRGGMGVVFKACHLTLGRIVALKTIHGKLATLHGQLRERFSSEVGALARLEHPNIIRLYEYGEDDGIPFFAQEFVEGMSLTRVLNERTLPAPVAAAWCEALARAMQYAHEQGIIHRDLKPDNVLLTRDMIPKIADFGLAKHFQSESGLTQTGAIVGTPSYMAPEQANGLKDIGPAADVYALGAILYQMLTGRPPFRGVSIEDTLSQVRRREPVSPRLLSSRCPRDLETICLKCLAKEPERRYASAKELADDLGRFREGKPIQARPVNALERGWRWCGRHPAVAALLGTLCLAVIVAIAVAVEFSRRAEVLEQQLYANRIAIAERELTLNQDLVLAGSLLEKCPARLRGWEWHYLMRLRDGARPPLRGHTAGLWDAQFSPDGRRLVTASIDGTAKVWDAATGRELLTFSGHQLPQLDRLPTLGQFLPPMPRLPVTCVAYSPDGQFIATGSLAPNLANLGEITNPRKALGVVKVWNAETGKVAVTFDKHIGLVNALTFSPDGSRIASGNINDEKSFVICDARTGQEIQVVRDNPSHIHRLSYSPDGQLLLTGHTDGSVVCWEAATLKKLRTIEAHSVPVYGLAFTQDGRRFASASFDGTIGVWDTATGRAALPPLRGHTGAAMGVAFSPDGQRIASAGYDKTVRLWDAATGEEKLTLRGHNDTVCSVVFSPKDGLQLLSASFDQEARIWDAAPRPPSVGSGLFTLTGHTDRVNAVACSPDGRLIASGSYDKTIRLWDATSGQPLRTLSGHNGPIWGLAFSPDSARLASASWDRTVKVWEAATGSELVTFTQHGTPAHGVAFSPDGKHLVSSSWEGLVKVWDSTTGKETVSCAGHLFPTLAVAFHPDGKLMASGSGDRTIKIWNAESGKEVCTLRGHQGLVSSVAFSPDRRLLASGSWDHTVKVWDIKTRKELRTIQSHTDRVQSVLFSPDGTRIATASEDKTVRIWEVATGREVVTPCHHHGVVWSVAFSPDGKRVVAGCWSPEGWVRSWSTEK